MNDFTLTSSARGALQSRSIHVNHRGCNAGWKERTGVAIQRGRKELGIVGAEECGNTSGVREQRTMQDCQSQGTGAMFVHAGKPHTLSVKDRGEKTHNWDTSNGTEWEFYVNTEFAWPNR